MDLPSCCHGYSCWEKCHCTPADKCVWQLLGIHDGKAITDVKHSHMAATFLLKCTLNFLKIKGKQRKKKKAIFKHKGYSMKEEKA